MIWEYSLPNCKSASPQSGLAEFGVPSTLVYPISSGLIRRGVKASLTPHPIPLCWRIPIFPDRRQSSIFGTTELNFCVRNGYRWTLCVIYTNFYFENLCPKASNQLSLIKLNLLFGEPKVLKHWIRWLSTKLFYISNALHLQGLEPWTHWLRVSCSTNWAKGANLKASA